MTAKELKGESYHVVSVIGDGALTGGMAFEALNNAAELKKNFIIVLNDNDMSISPENVGGLSSYLGSLRTAEAYMDLKVGVTGALSKIPNVGEKMVNTLRKTKNSLKQLVIPGMFFEDMGIKYLGPVDGHNMRSWSGYFRRQSGLRDRYWFMWSPRRERDTGRLCDTRPDFMGQRPFRLIRGSLRAREEIHLIRISSLR